MANIANNSEISPLTQEEKHRMIQFSNTMHVNQNFQRNWNKTDTSFLASFTYFKNQKGEEVKQTQSDFYPQNDCSYQSQAAFEQEILNLPSPLDNDDDLLITEKGLQREKNIAKQEIDGKGTQRRSSALRPVNQSYVPFTNYFHIPKSKEHKAKAIVESILQRKEGMQNFIKNPSQLLESGFHDKPKHARFKGLCPYGYDQAFYMLPDNSTLCRGTFKGGKLVEESQLALPQNNKTVTTMKIVGAFYLAIGYFDGSFLLIDFQNDLAEILEVQTSRKGKEFVRDFYLYQKPNSSSERFLAVLYVDQSDVERTYFMSQFYIYIQKGKNMSVKLSSEQAKLFSIQNNDEKSSRFEHRREFYWLEQFRPLGHHCLSFQLNKTTVGILDLKQSLQASSEFIAKNEKVKPLSKILKAKLSPTISQTQLNSEFALFHQGFNTGNVLNWTLLAPLQPSDFSLENDLKLTLINSNGIFSVQLTKDGDVQSQKFSIVNDSEESLANELWKPFDVLKLENNILMIAGTMGLFKVKFSSQNEMTIKLLESDNFYQLSLSYCGRIIAATGRSKNIELYEAPKKIFQEEEDPSNDVRKLCNLPYDNVFYLVMSSEQIFFQFKPMKCWVIIDLQSSSIVRTQKPRIRINNKRKYKKILYDKVYGDNRDYSVGIVCKETKFYPDDNYSKNIIGFKGGAVMAIDLNPVQDTDPKEITLMTKEEAKNGYIVCNINMHKSKLSWLVAYNQEKDEELTPFNDEKQARYNLNNICIMVRQQDLGEPLSSRKQVDIKNTDLNYALFNGFYLTMIRDNPQLNRNIQKPLLGSQGDCILTLCDSREPDLREFDSKEYFLIKFTNNFMQASQADLSLQMPIKITKKLSANNLEISNISKGENKEQMLQAFSKAAFIKRIEEKLEELQIEVDSNKTCFVLNDGTACSLIDYQGKHLFTKISGKKQDQSDKIRKWNIGAQELKISPKGNRVVFEKDNQCYVAKLNIEYETKRNEDEEETDICETEQLFNKWPLQISEKNAGLSRLKTLYWLSNDYFAVGDYTDEFQEPVSYSIFRSTDGRIICRFYLRNELEFLKCSTGPNLHFSNVTGILDRKTSKIYDTSLVTLLHLGARRFNLRPKPLWQKHSQMIEKGQKIMVLNALAPALFFQNLLDLENHRLDSEKQKEIVTNRVMRSSVIETKTETKPQTMFEKMSKSMVMKIIQKDNPKIQNMFQYLCKQNEAELLEAFLLGESNYFTDGNSPSPMSETTVVCSKVVNDWLQTIDQNRSREIYAGFEIKELISITKLPIAKVEQICEHLTYDITKKLKFSSAILKKRAFALIGDHDELTNSEEQDKIAKALFECDKNAKKDIIPKRGNPFNVYVSLMKFPLVAGSEDSKDLLDNIKQAGEENNNIYLIKLIQKLLDYKRSQIVIPKMILFSLHLSYLFCCMALPYLHQPTSEDQTADENDQVDQNEDSWRHKMNKRQQIMVTVYLTIFLNREFITMMALHKRRQKSGGKIKLHQSIATYWGVWNFLDWINIISMICYLNTEKPAYYSMMVLITWFNLLQYMRYIAFFRFFINLVANVFTDRETWKFLIVLGILLLGFSSSYLLLDLDHSCRVDSEVDCMSFLGSFKLFIWTSFGDFGFSDQLQEDSITQETIQWIVLGLAIFTMCIVMLNLLIGILSKAMDRILESQVQTEYSAINEIVYDLEVFMSAPMFYCCNWRTRFKQEPMHLIFAEPIIEEQLDETKAEIQETREEIKQNQVEIRALSDKIDKLVETLTKKGE